MKRLSIISSVLLSILLILVSVGLIKYFQTTQQSNQPANNLLTVATITPLPTTTTTTTATTTPTATLTATLLPTFTATANPITKPTPTIMFSVGHTKPITLPTPTLIPSATPTPTFEPLHGQAIGGYVFSTARLVPNVPSGYYDLIEWLPDDPNKLLVLDNYRSVEVIDIGTGTSQIYTPDVNWVDDAVWIPNQQAVAYMLDFEPNLEIDYLYIVKTSSDLNNLKSSFTTTAHPPLVISPNGNDVILFDENWQLTQVDSTNKQAINFPFNTKIYKPPTQRHGDLYHAIQSPDKSKAFYYNDDYLLLIDFVTNNLTEIDIENLKGDDMPPLKPIKDAVWSPDGTKIALKSVYSRYDIFWIVLDLITNNISYVGDNFNGDSDITWAPDSRHILSYPNIYSHPSGYGMGALFLFDTITQQRYAVAALPDINIIQSSIAVLWSPTGKHIAVVFAVEPEQPNLYIIDVTQP